MRSSASCIWYCPCPPVVRSSQTRISAGVVVVGGVHARSQAVSTSATELQPGALFSTTKYKVEFVSACSRKPQIISWSHTETNGLSLILKKL